MEAGSNRLVFVEMLHKTVFLSHSPVFDLLNYIAVCSPGREIHAGGNYFKRKCCWQAFISFLNSYQLKRWNFLYPSRRPTLGEVVGGSNIWWMSAK